MAFKQDDSSAVDEYYGDSDETMSDTDGGPSIGDENKHVGVGFVAVSDTIDVGKYLVHLGHTVECLGLGVYCDQGDTEGDIGRINLILSLS